MGIVYRAEDPLIHRTVAVKVLHAGRGLSEEQVRIARERFRRESQAAARIDHPNVIRVFDAGEEDKTGEMYIVMEYLSGPSLEDLINGAELGLDKAAEIIGQIASGLDAAHAQGLVHRDIKPSNILFNEAGAAKIVDFGITQVASSSLTQDMTRLGTPAYMSPEQVNGRLLDARADLFSLGVLSYEMLTGSKPFAGTDAVSVAYAIAHTHTCLARSTPSSSACWPRKRASVSRVGERSMRRWSPAYGREPLPLRRRSPVVPFEGTALFLGGSSALRCSSRPSS